VAIKNKEQVREVTNSKDALEYMKNEAKKGETIIFDERANAIHPRRIQRFSK